MPSTQLREQPGHYLCGVSFWHPAWLQRFATTKGFLYVYGLLGTIQAMSYMYFVVTLTTIEKRFKIPSQTTGIILSGNEISQILLSLILTYIGGQRNRPRWIAWGVVFCGLSCFILALPHVIYGAGIDSIRLTEEYINETKTTITNQTDSMFKSSNTASEQLCDSPELNSKCEDLLSIVPLILIFLSQFVLGIGNTLYYALGQTYLDDNTKKTNTPLMMAAAMSLRMIGPIFGFVLGFVSLNMFIDPSKTPIIDNKDPRWLGAWWFGWMILGTLMVVFSGLIGLFPKQLPKRQKNADQRNTHMPQFMQQEEAELNESINLRLGQGFTSTATLDEIPGYGSDLPKLKDFPKALMRLLRNKLLIYNIVSAIFYLLGATGYMTFMSRYMEVQFHKSAQSATIVIGPLSILGMVIALLGSGIVITKFKPKPSKVLMWNVIVGFIYILGQISYLFLYCPDSVSVLNHQSLNLTTNCNANCSCKGVSFAPVCHEETGTTYFSACHAGCYAFDSEQKIFSNCSCLNKNPFEKSITATSASFFDSETTTAVAYRAILRTTTSTSTSTATTTSTTTSATPSTTISTATSPATEGLESTSNRRNIVLTFDEVATTIADFFDETTISTTSEGLLERSRRAATETVSSILKPGICLEGCNAIFWTYAFVSTMVNWFGTSGRIGNLLVNYRAVATEDKSFAQGLSLMLISLFALIPGPIIFGRVIDSTCLVWTKTCSGNGNCQIYDQARFRYLLNGIAICLTVLGIFFDFLVWYHGRSLDLYGEKAAKRLEELKHRNKAIAPLLANNSANK